MKPSQSSLKSLRLLIVAFFLLLVLSCEKSELFNLDRAPLADAIDPAVVKTPDDIRKAETIVQFAKLLRRVYANHPQVVEEVNATIASGYYEDETVMVKDLLHPESSPIYRMQSFQDRMASNGVEVGSFKHALEEEFGMKISTNARVKDVYFIDDELSIYFPYHEITQYYTYPVTVASATTDANSVVAPPSPLR